MIEPQSKVREHLCLSASHRHTNEYQGEIAVERLSSKESPAMQEIQVVSLGLEDPLEKGMATHSSILSWRIP